MRRDTGLYGCRASEPQRRETLLSIRIVTGRSELPGSRETMSEGRRDVYALRNILGTGQPHLFPWEREPWHLGTVPGKRYMLTVTLKVRYAPGG